MEGKTRTQTTPIDQLLEFMSNELDEAQEFTDYSDALCRTEEEEQPI